MNKVTYNLDLMDAEDLLRLKTFLDNQYNILTILKQDSDKSIDGGAVPYYKVNITFEETWV